MTRLALLATAACLLAGTARAQYPDHPRTTPGITAADLSARDRAISVDAFGGRGPGTPEGEATADWIAEDLRHLGVQPGNHGSYFQNVPAVGITLDVTKSTLAIDTNSGTLTPRLADDVVFWSPHYDSPDAALRGSEIVFAGYGVVAPEYKWNDYAGLDVRGKTVIVLINDPGNEDARPDPAFFKGKAMTYYGRWTYKYEEAARQGAAAVLIVHETAPAAYGWDVVRNSNSGKRLWLDTQDGNARRATIEGWMTRGTAEEVFRRAGLDYATMKAAANTPGFRAMPLAGEKLSVTAHSTIGFSSTRNVIGVIPGARKPDEVVLFTAHWDHLGTKPNLPGPDKIYNGAVDNGTGVASILEIAEAFTHRAQKPARSVGFCFWTLEESGLLGSAYYAAHPVFPLRQTIAGLNIDALMVQGPTHDLTVVGSGASDLEDLLAARLKQDRRVPAPDPEPEKGYFYRSDHISLAKVGVPMLYVDSGIDLLKGGTRQGLANRADYREKHYHQPSDAWSAALDFSGPAQDVRALYDVGAKIADSDIRPNWYAKSEFRAVREQSLK